MARYLLTGKIYRGDRIVQAGEIIEMADDIAPAPCMLRIADRVAEPEPEAAESVAALDGEPVTVVADGEPAATDAPADVEQAAEPEAAPTEPTGEPS